jgi:hypothetical protein
MERSNKKKGRKMQDCRECSYLRWDFKEGRFLCDKAWDWQIEELHLIPKWCPLTNTESAAISTKNKALKQTSEKT